MFNRDTIIMFLNFPLLSLDAPPSSIWRILRSTVIYETNFNDCMEISCKLKDKIGSIPKCTAF